MNIRMLSKNLSICCRLEVNYIDDQNLYELTNSQLSCFALLVCQNFRYR